MSSYSTLSISLCMSVLSISAWAGPGPGGSGVRKGDTPFVDTLMVEGLKHHSSVFNGWGDGVTDTDQEGFVTQGALVLQNLQNVVSKSKRARAEHESHIDAERGVSEEDGCVTWSTELSLDGGYDMPHREGCALQFNLSSGPVGVCREIARFSALARTDFVNVYDENTYWSGAIGTINTVPTSLTDGLAFVYEVDLEAGESISVSTTVVHEGYVDDPKARLGGNEYHGYSNIKITTPHASFSLSASANQGQAGVFSESDDDSDEYTALF